MEFDSQSKLNDLDEDIKKHSDDIKIYLEQLKETFLKEPVKNTYELYKKEINSFYTTQLNDNNLIAATNIVKSTNLAASQKSNEPKKAPVQQLFQPYQCLLGVLEVLMEYNFSCNNYRQVSIKHYFKNWHKI